MSDVINLKKYQMILRNHIANLKKSRKIYVGHMEDESLDQKHKDIYQTEIQEIDLEISEQEEQIKEYQKEIDEIEQKVIDGDSG